MSTGSELRKIRWARSLTLHDVESAAAAIASARGDRRLAIPVSRLSEYETRSKPPNIFRLYALAVIYDVPLQELLSLCGVPSDPLQDRGLVRKLLAPLQQSRRQQEAMRRAQQARSTAALRERRVGRFRRKETILESLCRGRTAREAARECGVSAAYIRMVVKEAQALGELPRKLGPLQRKLYRAALRLQKVRDRSRRQQALRAEALAQTRASTEQDRLRKRAAILRALGKGDMQAAIARRIGVSPSLVSLVKAQARRRMTR